MKKLRDSNAIYTRVDTYEWTKIYSLKRSWTCRIAFVVPASHWVGWWFWNAMNFTAGSPYLINRAYLSIDITPFTCDESVCLSIYEDNEKLKSPNKKKNIVRHRVRCAHLWSIQIKYRLCGKISVRRLPTLIKFERIDIYHRIKLLSFRSV